MNKLLALLLLFGIGGCATTMIGVTPDGVSDDSWLEWKALYSSSIANGASTYDFKKNQLGVSSKVFYKIDKENKKIYFKAKGNPLYGLKTSSQCTYSFLQMNIELPKLCQNYFGSYVKLFPEVVEVPLTCNFGILPPTKMLVIKNEDFSVECYTTQEYTAQIKADNIQREIDAKASEALYRKVRDKKAKVALASNKSKCLQYGFKDNTDGMGLCLIELDKLDAIKNQATAANLAQSNLIARQQAEAKKQRQAQALINLGAMIGGAGVPTSPKSKPANSSYPNSYSSSRTVPSNQNCPLLSIPLKKQEVKNGNRICYY